MNRGSISAVIRKGALYSGLIVLSDTAGLGVDSLLLARNMFHFFTLFTLAQAAILFLLGGAIDVTGSLSFSRVSERLSRTEKEWRAENHRKAQSRAAPYIVAGLILLGISFALAYPLG